MLLYTIGKIAIALQIILLVAWAYSMLIKTNGSGRCRHGYGFTIGLCRVYSRWRATADNPKVLAKHHRSNLGRYSYNHRHNDVAARV